MTTPRIPRPCHWLRPNATSKRPNLILFLDTEAHLIEQSPGIEKHTFRCGWACLARYIPGNGLIVIKWTPITDPLDFWHRVSILAYTQNCLYIVAHGIDYDARILHAFSILPGIGWTPKTVILGDTCKFFTFETDKHTIALLDNLNYWHMPLDHLGADFGIPKLPIDLRTADDETLSEYCRRDVEILVRVWDYWLSFLDDHDLGDFAITVSGQAIHSFRHRFMSDKIGIHNNKQAVELERASYRGGRCSVYRVGEFDKGPYYKLDVNGLYSAAMQDHPTPTKLVKVIVDVDPPYLRKLLTRYMCIADVILETDQPAYAIHSKGRNIFPVGSFRVTLTTWELLHALAHDHIRAIGPVALYDFGYTFTDYIAYFTPLRQLYKTRGDLARSQICKQIRNSLYGKFGQRGYKQKVIGDAPLDKVSLVKWLDLDTGAECIDLTFGGVVIRQEKIGESFDSFPGIASHVAAKGRMLLWDYMRQLPADVLYYADTDSLFVDHSGRIILEPHIDPLRLGALKVEGITDHLEIRAKKDYTFGEQRTRKGLKRSATQDDHGIWHQEHFTGIKWSFRQGSLDEVYTYDATQRNIATITDGDIDKKGFVHPPRFAIKQEDVADLVKPRDPYSWDWWLDVPWFRSLAPRKRALFHLPRFLFVDEPPLDDLTLL